MPVITVAESVIGGLWTSIINMPVIAIVLFIVGLTLLTAEIFLPGFGLAGGMGLLCLFAAVIFTANSFLEGLILSLIIIAALGIVLTIALYSASHGKLSRKLILRDSTNTESGYVGTPSYSAYLGKMGMALTVLRPSGTVTVDGERLDVVTEGEYLPAGAVVEVLRVEGNRIVVRQIGKA
ncbi:MAG: NfeD family protein [Clostridiaceae bacterium]|nr:NfeD family protein [Clostridiaceae bacterium]